MCIRDRLLPLKQAVPPTEDHGGGVGRGEQASPHSVSPAVGVIPRSVTGSDTQPDADSGIRPRGRSTRTGQPGRWSRRGVRGQGVGTLVARVLLAVPASAAPVKSSVVTHAVTAAMPPSVPAPQEGLSALTSLSVLPRLNTTERAGHFSSYDRTGGNADYGHPLYRDAEGNDVLAEVDRPGAISRMWFTGLDLNHVLRVYFNGEPTPRLQRPLGEIFAGTHSPFLAPLVADDAASSGGFVSYVPLEFAHSVRVTIDGLGSGYYNIDYHWYDPGTPLTTWTPALDVTAAQAQWASAGTPPVPPPGSMTRSGTVTAAAGGVSYLAELDGPGVISRLTLALPAVWPLAGGTPLTASRTAHLLNDLRLRIFWDGAATPSVDAPLGPLFSVGADGPRPVSYTHLR